MITIVGAFAILLGLSYATFNYRKIYLLSEGRPEMVEIAAAIRLGANTFIKHEYSLRYLLCSL